MSAPTPEQRATALAAYRLVLDIVEADETLPMPTLGGAIGEGRIYFYFHGPAARHGLTALEDALPCELTGAIDPQDANHYVLSGEISGVPVRIGAWAKSVAERKVIGRRTVEDIEWVRLPVEDEAQNQEGPAAA